VGFAVAAAEQEGEAVQGLRAAMRHRRRGCRRSRPALSIRACPARAGASKPGDCSPFELMCMALVAAKPLAGTVRTRAGLLRPAYIESMSAQREELHRLVEELPEDEVLPVLDGVRRASSHAGPAEFRTGGTGACERADAAAVAVQSPPASERDLDLLRCHQRPCHLPHLPLRPICPAGSLTASTMDSPRPPSASRSGSLRRGIC
jgi:hypothetical protein